MTAQDLKNSILQQAIQGKLLPQNPADEPASELLKKISAERQKLIDEGKIKNPPQLPPITDDEKPFDIPENWQWFRWGELAYSIQYGYNAPATTSGKIKMLRISDIKNNFVDWSTVPFCEIVDDEIENYLLRVNDILFARVGGTVGKSLLVENLPEPSIFASYLIRTNYNKNLIPRYLKIFMESPLYWTQLKGGTLGTAQPNCNGQKLSKMLIPLPPLAEQKRIVEKLEEILPLVERYDELEQRLTKLDKEIPDKLKKSLLQQAIQGKLTEQLTTDGDAKDLLEKIRAEKSKLISEGKIKKEKPLPTIKAGEIPFDIPENWKWVRLGEICEYIQRGKSPKYSTVKKYPVIAQKCNQTTGFYIDKAKFIDPDSIKSYSEERFLQDNDLLWNSTGLGTVGRMAIYNSEKNPYELAVADSHVTVIRPFKNFVANKFIFNYIISPVIQENIETMVSGSTKQKELATQTVKELLIPLPPLAEQKRIVERLEELLPLCERLII